MERLRRGPRRRIAASIACLAFVLQALVPALAHAAASVARAQLYPGELCSVDPHAARARLAKAIDAEAPVPAQPAPAAAHCPFCALPFGADTPAAPARFGWNAPTLDSGAEPAIVRSEGRFVAPARERPQAPRAPPRG